MSFLLFFCLSVFLFLCYSFSVCLFRKTISNTKIIRALMKGLSFLSFMKVIVFFLFMFFYLFEPGFLAVFLFFFLSVRLAACVYVCLSFCLSVSEDNFKYENNPSFDERVIVPKFYEGNWFVCLFVCLSVSLNLSFCPSVFSCLSLR
jgi:hypothetical protein